MRFWAAWILAVALTCGTASAMDVFVDYDPAYDRSQVKTFAWTETSETSVEESNPLLHSRIVNGIEYYLTLSGLHEAQNAPDIYVTYHTSTKKEVSVDTTVHGYGYPGGWGYHGRRAYPYGGYGVATGSATVRTYQRGTLIVDIWDARTNKIIWRGIAADITVTDNPSKMKSKIDKAIKKMVSKWQKMKAKDAG